MLIFVSGFRLAGMQIQLLFWEQLDKPISVITKKNEVSLILINSFSILELLVATGCKTDAKEHAYHAFSHWLSL